MRSNAASATHLRIVLLLLIGIAVTRVKAAPLVYQLNESIEVSTTGAWDNATVIEVGVAGTDHEGEYKVHFIGYGPKYDRWLQPIYFRKVAGGAPAAGAASTAGTVAPAPAPVPAQTPSSPAVASATNAAGGPRVGKYNISSYGAVGRPPLFLGHIELQAGGKYRISRKREGDYYGEGTYSFDAAASAVKWLSGPCKEDAWSGTFTSERDGKTHKIRLRSTTIATNTVE